jgi:hypothetical protein
MSIYAKINSENIVDNVILCEDSDIGFTQKGNILKQTESTNFASVGHTYDAENNKFDLHQPFDLGPINENLDWESPARP